MKKSEKLTRKIGMPPGEIIYIGNADPEKTKIKLYKYDKVSFFENDLTKLENIDEIRDLNKINWLNITGFEKIEQIKNLSKIINVSELLLEDALHSDHIPKYEEGNDYLAIIVKNFKEESTEPSNNCIILKDGLVVSLMENPTDIIKTKIERIKNGTARARNKKADYLFYTLLDSCIDSYYMYFENIREELFDLESLILHKRNENHINKIYELNAKFKTIRKNLFPLKTAIVDLIESEINLLEKSNYHFFNDCKDHVNELIEYYNSFSDNIQSLINLNENNIVNNTNKVIKILTIIATIFIPLTFIAGIYGMNFKYMPELEWEFGYYFILGIMLAIGVGILLVIKYKKWY